MVPIVCATVEHCGAIPTADSDTMSSDVNKIVQLNVFREQRKVVVLRLDRVHDSIDRPLGCRQRECANVGSYIQDNSFTSDLIARRKEAKLLVGGSQHLFIRRRPTEANPRSPDGALP